MKAFLFCLLLITAPLFAFTGGDEPLKALVEIEQEGLEKGVMFVLKLVVNHEAILEVETEQPDFGGKFLVTRRRSSPRFVREAAGRGSGGASWAVFEFTLMPLEEGEQVIPPFKVSARGQELFTEEIPLTIAPERFVHAAPVLRWQTPLPVLKVGERATFRLTASDPRPFTKESFAKLHFDAPPLAIVESAVVTDGVSSAVIELSVLPMFTGDFAFKARDFATVDKAGNKLTLKIPELKCTIK